MDKFILSVLVENKFGVLARIVGLFSARGFNIDSLAVAETEDPTMSRLTMVVNANEKMLEQIKKQLNKLIDVVKVVDLTGKKYVEKELVLVKVRREAAKKEKLEHALDGLDARLLNKGKDSMIVEELGDTKKVQATLEVLKPFGIIEIVRTGKIAIQIEEDNKEE